MTTQSGNSQTATENYNIGPTKTTAVGHESELLSLLDRINALHQNLGTMESRAHTLAARTLNATIPPTLDTPDSVEPQGHIEALNMALIRLADTQAMLEAHLTQLERL